MAEMNDQTRATGPDPARVLKDTRRSLLKLVANIEDVLEAIKEPDKPSR
jgi:hypothetical protein